MASANQRLLAGFVALPVLKRTNKRKASLFRFWLYLICPVEGKSSRLMRRREDFRTTLKGFVSNCVRIAAFQIKFGIRNFG